MINKIKKSKINLFWWRAFDDNKERNFGDEISKDIIHKVFNLGCERVNEAEIVTSDLIATGSIIQLLLDNPQNATRQTPIYIWGSGMIMPKQHPLSEYNISNLFFEAVRGKKTQEELALRKDIALGDPGILASLAYKKSKKVSGRIGIIPHHAELSLSIVEKFKQDSRFFMISPIREAQEVISDITTCELILSSSLHGLIVADSFRIPNAHMQLSDILTGGDFKFEDYYSSIEKVHQKLDLDKIFDNSYLDGIKKDYKPIKGLRVHQFKLIRSFPFKKTTGSALKSYFKPFVKL
jgi:hypothetical protein